MEGMVRSGEARKRGSISLTFWVLGVLVASLSVTSLIQHWSNVGLHGLAARVIEYYRSLAHAAKEALFDWWTIQLWPGVVLPEWAIDFLSVWLLAGFGVLRGVLAFDAAQGEPSFQTETGSPDTTAWWMTVVILLFAPIAFLLFSSAAFVGLLAIWKDRSKPVIPNVPRHRLVDIFALFGGMYAPLVGTGLFFLWNAVQL